MQNSDSMHNFNSLSKDLQAMVIAHEITLGAALGIDASRRDGGESLKALLKQHNLEEFDAQLNEQGFVSQGDFGEFSIDELEEIGEKIGMKPAHLRRFKRLNLLQVIEISRAYSSWARARNSSVPDMRPTGLETLTPSLRPCVSWQAARQEVRCAAVRRSAGLSEGIFAFGALRTCGHNFRACPKAVGSLGGSSGRCGGTGVCCLCDPTSFEAACTARRRPHQKKW